MRKKLVVILLLLIAILLGWDLVVRYWPSEKEANTYLHARAKEIFEGREEQVKETSDFYDKVRKHHFARIELEANRYAVDHGVRNCPDNYQADNQLISMDLEHCPTGQFIRIVLPDEYREREYAVNLYAYSPDRQKKLEVVAAPVIKVVRNDGFSLASRLPSGNWKLRGKVRFIVGGDAHNVEIRLR